MSCSHCIKCGTMVPMYEKYCDNCVARYGVKQDPLFHKTKHWDNYEQDRKAEFERDLPMHVIVVEDETETGAEIIEHFKRIANEPALHPVDQQPSLPVCLKSIELEKFLRHDRGASGKAHRKHASNYTPSKKRHRK